MGNPETPLTPAQIATASETVLHEGYLRREAVQDDEALATLLLDPVPDETISSWAGRVAVHGKGVAKDVATLLCRVLNHTFSMDHDQKAIVGDETRGKEVAAAEEQGLMKT